MISAELAPAQFHMALRAVGLDGFSSYQEHASLLNVELLKELRKAYYLISQRSKEICNLKKALRLSIEKNDIMEVRLKAVQKELSLQRLSKISEAPAGIEAKPQAVIGFDLQGESSVAIQLADLSRRKIFELESQNRGLAGQVAILKAEVIIYQSPLDFVSLGQCHRLSKRTERVALRFSRELQCTCLDKETMDRADQ